MTTFEKSQRQSRCSWSANRSAGVPVLSPFVTARSLSFSTISSGGTVIFLTAHVTSLCSSLGRRRRRLHMTTIQLLLFLLRIIQCFYYNGSCYWGWYIPLLKPWRHVYWRLPRPSQKHTFIDTFYCFVCKAILFSHILEVSFSMLAFLQHRRHCPLKMPINHFSHISSLTPKELNRSRASNVSKRHFIKRRLHVLHMHTYIQNSGCATRMFKNTKSLEKRFRWSSPRKPNWQPIISSSKRPFGTVSKIKLFQKCLSVI